MPIPTAVAYAVPRPVPALKKPAPQTAWAAATAMLLAYKDGQERPLEEAVRRAGERYEKLLREDTALTKRDMADYLTALGLAGEPPAELDVDKIHQMLRRFGALWLTPDYDPAFSLDARIVTAIHGDGTPGGSLLAVIDPNSGEKTNLTLAQLSTVFAKQSSTTTAGQLIAIHWPPDTLEAISLPGGAVQSSARAYGGALAAGYDWSIGQAVTYDRRAAIDYARRHWNIPCNDGFIALKGLSGKRYVKVPAGTRFEHEFDAAHRSMEREHALLGGGAGRIEWEDLEDCTHFISCCIGQPPGDKGGGIPISYKQMGSPPNAPYGIVRVSTMVDYLLGRLGKNPTSYAQVIGTEKTKDNRHINSLVAGDLIAYWDEAGQRYYHLTLYLGNGMIGCHTYSRFDDPACTWDKQWDLGNSWTFLHLTV